MPKFRRIGTLAVLLCLAACSSGPAAAPPPACGPPPAPDVLRRSGWLGQIAAHPGDVGLVVDDGHGGVVAHRADAVAPLASAAKVVHLAAYGRAVAQGRVRPDEPVALADWERWYLPGSDGSAHPRALARLGSAPAYPLDDVVGAMIQESDNAAADFLRARLGDDALLRAAADGGWPAFDLPSYLGHVIGLASPALALPPETPRPVRAAAEAALARRYAADPAFRARQQRALADAAARPDYVAANAGAAEQANTGSAAALAAIHRALATGSYGPGSDVAMRRLQYVPPTPGLGRLGYKGGSYVGVLVAGRSVRRDDGSVAVGVVVAHRLPAGTDLDRAGAAQLALVIGAVRDPGALAALRCVA